MHAPGDVGGLGVSAGPGVRGRVGSLGDGLAADAEAVDDRIPRDGVEPGRARAAIRPVARAERQIAAKVSCTASSARSRSPSRRSASPNTGRA